MHGKRKAASFPAVLRRAAVLALTLTALFALVMAGPASAAKRKVPFGFFGAVVGDTASEPTVSDQALDGQLALMARSGVESVRATFAWDRTELSPGVYNWRANDRLTAAAARHGIRVLANVMWTPKWASSNPGNVYWARFAPRDPGRYAAFLQQLIARYGPKGSFWAANPGIPKIPIRQWQLWNEPMIEPFWATLPWPKTFTSLLKAAYPAVKRADKGATVVAASLVGAGRKTQWGSMRSLYKAGAKKYFDQVAIHPFTINPSSVKDTVARTLDIVRLVRKEMSSYGDSKKKVMITELTWPAAIGKVPTNRLLGLETTSKGQAQRLSAAYSALAKRAKVYRIAQVDWFAWATAYDANSVQSDVAFRFAGLTRFSGGAFSAQAILKTYAKAAAAQEGCRKGSDARRCGG